jgi:predicted short-subunit dehydrogenase-like oxidoreductase (DUF2520 family)
VIPICVVGRGRLGPAVELALHRAGCDVTLVAGREVDPTITHRVGVVLLAVPDAAIATVAKRLTTDEGCVVAHCSGSLGMDVLAPHQRVAGLHPVVSVPDRLVGADRLAGAWFAIAGDPVISEVVGALGGRSFVIDDAHRPRYHAAAVVASNHLVALLGQVQRLAGAAGAPMEAFWPLIEGTVANAEQLGVVDALTGPVARGDWDTVRGHLDSMDRSERRAYLALAAEAAKLIDVRLPPDLTSPDVVWRGST